MLGKPVGTHTRGTIPNPGGPLLLDLNIKVCSAEPDHDPVCKGALGRAKEAKAPR